MPALTDFSDLGSVVDPYCPIGTTLPGSSFSQFDLVHDRTGTSSLKWDFAAERGRPAGVLPLWVADMDHQVAPGITSALLWRVRHGIFGYTETDAAYDAAVTSWFARRYDWQVEASWNVVTPGVVPALALAVRALTAPGDAVVIEEPVYYPFREVIEDNGRVVAPAPLVRGDDGSYRRDMQALERTLRTSGAKVLLLCNPHNPVGRVWSRTELEDLAEIARRYDLTVVSDEIHADLALPGHRTTPFASLSPDAAARTIACTSPSKSFNLAGLQVANILIPSERLRKAFRAELAAVGYSQPNALGLTACQAAYESGDAWLDELRGHLAAARDHVAERLAAVPGVSVAPCEGTYLLWLDCHGLLDLAGLEPSELDEVMLEEAGLWLDDGAIFGAGGEGFTRINIACPRATLDQALDRLEAGVTALLARQSHRARAEALAPARAA
ncbi:MalY/PatB family protein [Actinomyces faecalis]|uniref:MalY/PatB family protein n=1 Tax=Actinomyces faecalis TaxID=2722820 RepID=UPI0015558BAE|nr:MalY/PatB family protein [Actinomyces faecalis]